MSSKTIQLGASSSALPEILPHLMPFHVDYTGPAPLPTYFLVNPAPPPEPSEPDEASLAQRVKTRFLSAFRGRTIQGLDVALPEGYGGVVLSSDDTGKTRGATRRRPAPSKSKSKVRKGSRATRNSLRGKKDDEDEEGDVTMEDQEINGDPATCKTLRPTAKFSSFTLWNPDVDVDEGRDEYLRALSEYQRLLAEVHHIDKADT